MWCRSIAIIAQGLRMLMSSFIPDLNIALGAILPDQNRRMSAVSPLYRFSGMPRMTAFEFLGQFLWQNSFEQLSGILIHHEHVAVPAPVHRRINVTAIFAIGRNSSPCQTAFLPLRIHV